MRLLISLILLAFPIAEIWLLVVLGQQYGWLLLLYLVVAAMLGLQLIRDEKLLFTGRLMQTLSHGAHPVKAIFGSARNMIAGGLLIIPGVITDIIAVILLLIPVKTTPTQDQQTTHHQANRGAGNQAANDDVIEGEFRRED
ncbi:MAG: FxsA family protein [Methylotenera sp.]|nr:FxsA family protein [Methylotenera sp.]